MDTDVTIALVIAAWITVVASCAWALRARRRPERRSPEWAARDSNSEPAG
jgi:hypothetical protein